MTGNVGRTFLENGEKLEPIIFPQPHYPKGAGQDLIEHLANFWVAIQCGYVLNIEKFEEYANKVDRLFRLYVPWHPNVPAVHLDIIHCPLIMRHFYPIPLSWLAEEPLGIFTIHMDHFLTLFTYSLSFVDRFIPQKGYGFF